MRTPSESRDLPKQSTRSVSHPQSLDSVRAAIAGLSLVSGLGLLGCATTSALPDTTMAASDDARGERLWLTESRNRAEYVRSVNTDGWRRIRSLIVDNPRNRELFSIVDQLCTYAAGYSEPGQSMVEHTASHCEYLQRLQLITREQAHRLIDIVTHDSAASVAEQVQMIRIINVCATGVIQNVEDSGTQDANYGQVPVVLSAHHFRQSELMVLMHIARGAVTDPLLRSGGIDAEIMTGIVNSLRRAQLTLMQAHWLASICQSLLIRRLDPNGRRPVPAVASDLTVTILAKLAHMEIAVVQ